MQLWLWDSGDNPWRLDRRYPHASGASEAGRGEGV